MLFNSYEFLLFFPVVCLLYWGIRKLFGKERSLTIRNIMLLIASYYFYMCWQPIYALLLLTSTAVTYCAALMISKSQAHKRVWLSSAIIVNLAILFFYKYFNFVADSLNTAMESVGVAMHVPGLDVLLPVGISFYTFQALGYSIDVYRGDVKAERNFLTYALFVSFFPQLVAGPIERSKNLLRQFKEDREFDYDFAMSGLKLMLWGYFMKLCMADRAAIYVDLVFNDLHNHEGLSTLVASILFSLQIYGDFAGYTFIAIGCARIMGFALNDNFRRPYFAATITDFWRRWHISLSTWFRDYLYFPLGGSRTTKVKIYRNLLITFAVSGLWHGANWTFILWGFIHGAFQCIERWLGWNKKQWVGLQKFCHALLSLFIVNLAWMLFRANSMEDAWTAFQQMFSINDFSLAQRKMLIVFSGIAALIVFAKEFCEEKGVVLHFIQRRPLLWNHIWMMTLLLLIGLLGVFDGGQFIYFQF